MDAINDAPLNLSAASAAALADLQATAPTPAPPEGPAEVPEAAPVAEPAQEAAPLTLSEESNAPEGDPEAPVADPEPEAAPTPAEEAKKWSIRAAGKTVELTEEELVRRAQMGIDAEQKWQAAAARERELRQAAETLAQRENILKQIVMDPEKLEGLRKHMQAQFGLPEDPTEVVTAAQAVQMVQRQLDQQATQLRAEMEQRAFEREVETLASTYENTVANTVAQVLKAHPVLDAYEDLAAVLKLDVAKQLQANPTDDIREVTRMMEQAASRRASKLQTTIDNHKKMVAVRAAKGQEPSPVPKPTSRIDPPGGTGVRPTPTPQGLKLGDPRLTQSIVAELQEAFNRKG